MHQDYFNHYDPDDNYEEILFKPDRFAQSAEMNALQSMHIARVRRVADVLFKDGDIIKSAQIIVDPTTGAAFCEAGQIYLKGAVRAVSAATLTIPTVGTVSVGIYLRTAIITEQDDPRLYNPVTDLPSSGMPGAWRLRITPEWGIAGGEGEYYPVHVIVDGIVRSNEPPPNLDAFMRSIAAYDCRSTGGGTYVVNGLRVAAAADLDDGRQCYTVAEGSAQVNGYGITLSTSRRLIYDAQPELKLIASEPHNSATGDAQRIDLDRYPVAGISVVTITAERTVTITHGSYSGVADPLPDTSVLELREVRQGATIYSIGNDCKLTAGKVDWSPMGLEPQTGSTYEVTYRHLKAVTPEGADHSGFTVTGAVPGTLITATYHQKLPRIDRLCLDDQGELIWIRGVAAEWNPRLPSVPPKLLALAYVHQTWDDARQVVMDAVKTVSMAELADYRREFDLLKDLVAQQRLESSLNIREQGVRKGLFVDPLSGDEMRDQGIVQTAAVVGGALTLPVALTVRGMPNDIPEAATLPYTVRPLIEQPLRTGSVKINPYDSFAPLPARIALNPAVDHFVDTATAWTSDATSIASGGAVSSAGRVADFLRQIDVQFAAEGFGSGEALASIKFDGIETQFAAPAADAQGRISGSFRVPPNVAAGTKNVEFLGAADSYGRSVFTGSVTLVTETRQQSASGSGVIVGSHEFWFPVDPQGETFVAPESAQIVGLDLWFTKVGDSPVVVQLREVAGEVAGRTIIAECRLQPSEINVGGWTSIAFPLPVYRWKDQDGAFVILCNDTAAEIAVADLGQYDAAAGRWVSAQPYQIGVRISSSNGAAWTIHQNSDVTFRLLRPHYTETARSVDLGRVAVAEATDLMLLALAETPSAETRMEYRLALPGGETLTVAAGQPVRLPAPISGEVAISAHLYGTAAIGPVLVPGTQLLIGKVAEHADYVSRAFPAGQNTRLKTVIEAQIPGGAGVALSVRGVDPGDVWQALAQISATPVGDGWYEIEHELRGLDEERIQVRVELTGSTAARPQVRELRFISMQEV